MLPFVRTNEGISVVCGGKNHLIRREHLSFRKLMEAVNAGDEKLFLSLLDKETVIQHSVKSVKSGISYVDGKLYQNGVELTNRSVFTLFKNRIEGLIRDGLSVKPLLKFIENLLQNPSAASIEYAYEFIERNNLPITEDGFFLAYKSVRSDYKDKYSGTIDNSVGKTPSMPRNLVDDNRKNYCSQGLHVGGLAYSGPGGWYNSTGDRVIIVKVHPKDVVSVPEDHNGQKCRVSDYSVLKDYCDVLNNKLYKATGNVVSLSNFKGKKVKKLTDLDIGDDVVIKYNGQRGEELRYLAITNVDEDSGKILGLLNEPEAQAGYYRSFLWTKVLDMKII